MIKFSTPTRAEANDVASTLLMGASGLVLAAETAIGKHPVGAVKMIKSIIRQYYKKESGIDLLRPSGQKRENYCANVKADWGKSNVEKTEVNEDQEKVLKTQKQIKKNTKNLYQMMRLNLEK